MSLANLRLSTLRQSRTPIKIWDGTDFTESPVLVNLKSAPHTQQVRSVSTMGTIQGDPLKDVFTFSDPTGQVFNILESTQNTFQSGAYGTTYFVRKAPFLADISGVGTPNPAASSGFSYEDTPVTVKKEWVLFEHDRYYNAPAPIVRQGIHQMFVGYLPNGIGVKKGVSVKLNNGLTYEVVTAEMSTSRAIQCFLILIGDEHTL